MFIEILIVVAILIQTIATVCAIRLVRVTKYNSIWWLFIIGFSLLTVERCLQFRIINGHEIPLNIFWWTGLVVSVGLSVGVMYAHKLFKYIERLNQQRQYVSKRILTAVLRTEEKSRSRFSKDLHDGLGPLLSSAKMSLSVLDDDTLDAEKRKILMNVNALIEESIHSLREISNNLSPRVLNDFGLVRGVQNFITKCMSLNTIKIHFVTNFKSERFDRDVEVVLYRVVCELINNSLKHAECSEIELALTFEESVLALDYRDNGKGFNPRDMMDCGMGLSNISSRINSLSGELVINSEIGYGMEAKIKVFTSSTDVKKSLSTKK